MNKKTQYALLAALFAGTFTFAHAAVRVKKKAQKAVVTNPLLLPDALPYGAPAFDKIKEADYLPAIKEGIRQQRAEIARIVNNKKTPTFANTVLAYEKSGVLLDHVESVFDALAGANKTPGIAEADKQITPLMVEFSNEVSFNQKLFQRIKYVYDHELNTLQGEDKKLLEKVYTDFVRSGALLSAEKAARMKEINNRLAVLQQEFVTVLPQASNESTVWVNDVKELSGLSQADIAQCKKDAESRGGKAPYCIVITNTTNQPILASLDNRDLRRRVYEASIHRADGTRGVNTFGIVSEMAKLRAEKAKLMGFDNYANYSLAQTMAQNTTNAYSFLNNLIKAYRPKADAESKEIEEYARKTEGNDFHLQPYDRFYYSAKMKKAKYNFTDDEAKPYFNVDSVLVNGVFYAAHKVYGLTFRERFDLPTYHKTMKVFDVIDADGKQLALFYTDYYRRPEKRGGAWMSSYRKQSGLRNQLPIIYNVLNVAKAPEGEATLLTWDEAQTLFHEFGHALHGMLSNCTYNTLSGTAVSRDFVEMPSQFNEFFASLPEVFDHFAKHYKTQEAMPAELKEKMLSSMNFQSAYALGENLAATCLDMAWHTLSVDEIPTADKAAEFEKSALKKVGLLDEQVPPRYSTSYFNHVWGGGYAAGYYSYLWSEVLADNVASYFSAHGPLTRSVGDAFRSKVLSKGNTLPLMQIFSDFTGLQQPDPKDLLKAKGL